MSISIIMNFPIEFNYQLFFDAAEVRDITPDRMLPSEFESAKLLSSQASPQERFCVGLVFTKFTAKRDHVRRKFAHQCKITILGMMRDPLPLPLSLSGRGVGDEG